MTDSEILAALDARFATPAPARIIMASSKWLVPRDQRPKIHIPNDPPPQVAQRGIDYRRNLLVAKSGAKVVRA